MTCPSQKLDPDCFSRHFWTFEALVSILRFESAQFKTILISSPFFICKNPVWGFYPMVQPYVTSIFSDCGFEQVFTKDCWWNLESWILADQIKFEKRWLGSLSPLVAMMQSANPGQGHHANRGIRPSLNRTCNRWVFIKAIMGPVVVVILEIGGQYPFQVALI